MENITGNELDCPSEETEAFIIVTNLIRQMQITCAMAVLMVHVALESDITCLEQLQMDRNCFMAEALGVEGVDADEVSDGSTTVNKNDKSPEERPKKKAKVSKTLVAGLSDFADKVVSSLEMLSSKLEMLEGRMGYAHDLSGKRIAVNEALEKLPITAEHRVRAGLAITKKAQTVDYFLSLKSDEEKMILVQILSSTF